ncbi:MAG: bifunctional folylpolyglutamate synthase/dihydrofolate synthase [Ignavibacteriaceae bacterium]|nr:bifunctional folylpolyglutamate synthase/dihydrofolate synthase [Ignavibacteriaceae bacterium]
MDVESSLKKLFSLHTFGIKLGLENTIKFLEHLGNPQNFLRTIHVAGSNGKGSSLSFIASILQESGYKTGLYTSPHFVKFNERIVINGKQIDDEYIAGFIEENEKFIDDFQLTFFEVTTAMAFKYFLEMKTDYCVIETGLGGRLDATNVLNPLAVVITTISLEHTNVLGNTIAQIASEKAAIIKNGSKVFTGILKNDAKDIVEQKCKETNSQLFQLKDFISNGEDSINVLIDESISIEMSPPLRGKYQKYNAALAALTISKTFPSINKENYLLGILNVSRNTGLQGRYEYFNKKPDIIFDSAHNPEGIENFLNEFSKEVDLYRNRVLLFGAMRDKAIGEMLKMLSGYFNQFIITGINYERAASLEEISQECNRLNINYSTIKEPGEFIRKFKKRSKDECLVVLGSMYLIGEIKAALVN